MFETSMVYIVNSRTVKAMQRDPVSLNKTSKNGTSANECKSDHPVSLSKTPPLYSMLPVNLLSPHIFFNTHSSILAKKKKIFFLKQGFSVKLWCLS